MLCVLSFFLLYSHLCLIRYCLFVFFFFFFFNDTATTEIYTLSLHDALPICSACACCRRSRSPSRWCASRSEEHTSELQSRSDLVCRLLLEKKKKKRQPTLKEKTLQQTNNQTIHPYNH